MDCVLYIHISKMEWKLTWTCQSAHMVSITYCKSKTQAGEPIFKILAKLLTTTNTNNKKIDIVTWKVETRIGIICINQTNLLRQNKITHLCFIFSVSVSWPETTKEWGFYCMKKNKKLWLFPVSFSHLRLKIKSLNSINSKLYDLFFLIKYWAGRHLAAITDSIFAIYVFDSG